jgi:septal ring factor EnvC (AmiA/AmiB activator)
MDDNRLRSFERDLGRLEASVAALNDQLETLAHTVGSLNNTIQRSRGALVVIGALATGLAASLGALLNTFVHK